MTPKREEILAVARSFDPTSNKGCGVNVIMKPSECETFYLVAYRNGMDDAARIADATVCDVHLPTGVRIYGTKAAAAIRKRIPK